MDNSKSLLQSKALKCISEQDLRLVPADAIVLNKGPGSSPYPLLDVPLDFLEACASSSLSASQSSWTWKVHKESSGCFACHYIADLGNTCCMSSSSSSSLSSSSFLSCSPSSLSSFPLQNRRYSLSPSSSSFGFGAGEDRGDSSIFSLLDLLISKRCRSIAFFHFATEDANTSSNGQGERRFLRLLKALGKWWTERHESASLPSSFEILLVAPNHELISTYQSYLNSCLSFQPPIAPSPSVSPLRIQFSPLASSPIPPPSAPSSLASLLNSHQTSEVRGPSSSPILTFPSAPPKPEVEEEITIHEDDEDDEDIVIVRRQSSLPVVAVPSPLPAPAPALVEQDAFDELSQSGMPGSGAGIRLPLQQQQRQYPVHEAEQEQQPDLLDKIVDSFQNFFTDLGTDLAESLNSLERAFTPAATLERRRRFEENWSRMEATRREVIDSLSDAIHQSRTKLNQAHDAATQKLRELLRDIQE